jgi:hypothetical protein
LSWVAMLLTPQNRINAGDPPQHLPDESLTLSPPHDRGLTTFHGLFFFSPLRKLPLMARNLIYALDNAADLLQP